MHLLRCSERFLACYFCMVASVWFNNLSNEAGLCWSTQLQISCEICSPDTKLAITGFHKNCKCEQTFLNQEFCTRAKDFPIPFSQFWFESDFCLSSTASYIPTLLTLDESLLSVKYCRNFANVTTL